MGIFIGVDVSQYQNLNWSLVKQSVNFVIFKGTGGDAGLYVDSHFLENLANVRGTGFDYGIYHFGGNEDAVTEANYFYQQCLTNLEVGVPVILDAETGNATDPAWCLQFLQHLESLIGFKPMIYMNHALMMEKDWSAVANANYGLWLADWDGDPNVVVSMHDWTFCAIQQYTDNGHINGISGNVDMDAFFAQSLDVWKRYGKPASAPTPAPVKPPIAPPAVTMPSAPVTTPVAPPAGPKTPVVEPEQPVVSKPVVSPTPVVVKPNRLLVFLELMYKWLKAIILDI